MRGRSRNSTAKSILKELDNRAVTQIERPLNSPMSLDSFALKFPWAAGYLFPELYYPSRVPDKYAFPSHMSRLATETVFTTVANTPLTIFWNPSVELAAKTSPMFTGVPAGVLQRLAGVSLIPHENCSIYISHDDNPTETNVAVGVVPANLATNILTSSSPSSIVYNSAIFTASSATNGLVLMLTPLASENSNPITNPTSVPTLKSLFVNGGINALGINPPLYKLDAINGTTTPLTPVRVRAIGMNGAYLTSPPVQVINGLSLTGVGQQPYDFNTEYVYTYSAALNNAARGRLVSAYQTIEYLGNPTTLSGTISRVVLFGRSALLNFKKSRTGGLMLHETGPLDYRKYVNRYRFADSRATSFDATTSEGPYYITTINCPVGSQFLIKTVRVIESIPLPEIEEYVGPLKESSSAASLEDQLKVIGFASDNAPPLTSYIA